MWMIKKKTKTLPEIEDVACEHVCFMMHLAQIKYSELQSWRDLKDHLKPLICCINRARPPNTGDPQCPVAKLGHIPTCLSETEVLSFFISVSFPPLVVGIIFLVPPLLMPGLEQLAPYFTLIFHGFTVTLHSFRTPTLWKTEHHLSFDQWTTVP